MSTDVPQRLSVWHLVSRCCPISQQLTFMQTSKRLWEASVVFTTSVFGASAVQRASRSRSKAHGAGVADKSVSSGALKRSRSLQFHLASA